MAGALAVFVLPIAQYPDITPPTVQVTASYPGANAQLVLDTVAAPIEQQVNGVENMLYMSSQCTNDGAYTLTVTFELGTDLNIAQVLVQNRVQLAMPVIPDIVQLQGVAVKKKSPSIMMIVNLFSKKDAQGNYRPRRSLPVELRHDPDQGRTAAPAGRRRRDLPGRARLQHARLARSRKTGHAEHDGRRRGQRPQGAERPGGRRPGRPAARAAGPELPAYHEHARPADHSAGSSARSC